MSSNENTTYSCVLCGNKLESKEALQEHFRGHGNKTIDSRGKSKNTKSTTTSSSKILNTSPDTEQIVCDVCPLYFDTITQAIQHMFRKHPDVRSKHYCPFCGMQFPLKYTKEKHLKTHIGMSDIGEFPCSECGVIFHNSKAQTYHFKSTHKRIMSFFKPVPTPPPSKKIRINNAHEAQSVYYCYLCGAEYIIKFNLQKHLESAHEEKEREQVPENLIRCTTCDALFYNKKAYDTHNIYHRPDDLYVASEEQRLQTVSRVDQDFDIRRVQLLTDKFIPKDKPKRRRPPPQKKQTVSNRKNFDDELSPTSSIDSSDSESDMTIKKAPTESSETVVADKRKFAAIVLPK